MIATPNPCNISPLPSPRMWSPTTFSSGPAHTILYLKVTSAWRFFCLLINTEARPPDKRGPMEASRVRGSSPGSGSTLLGSTVPIRHLHLPCMSCVTSTYWVGCLDFSSAGNTSKYIAVNFVLYTCLALANQCRLDLPRSITLMFSFPYFSRACGSVNPMVPTSGWLNTTVGMFS